MLPTPVLCPKCRFPMRVTVAEASTKPSIGLECTECDYTYPKEAEE